MQKPNLTYSQILNLNFGYLGLQVCFSLVIANTSRIFSSLGADTNELAFFWLVAPLSGIFLQPIVGYLSDKTWTGFGRRIPYIFLGVVITALLMILMPYSYVISAFISPVMAGVGIVFLIQSSLNLAMQPYRSLVGDMVNTKQANLGYSIQTIFNNLGSLTGSILPFVLAYWGVSNFIEGDEKIVGTVKWSFYIGAGILLITNLWTCIKVKEYPPKQFKEYSLSEASPDIDNIIKKNNKSTIKVILQLSIVQFFSWFAFYYIWVYMTEGIARNIWHTSDPSSPAYNDAANWFGVLTGAYSIVAAVFAIFLPRIADKISRKKLYALSLILGGISLISVYYIENQYLLLIPMIGIGISWSMILTIPFAILSAVIPSSKMGVYMGVFNITIVLPQIIAGIAGSFLFTHFAGETAIGMIIIAGISFLVAALSVALINDPEAKNKERILKSS